MPKVFRPQDQGPFIVLPYYAGVGEHLKRLGRTLDFTVYFKTSASLRSSLRNDKIKVLLDEKPGVVYKITCGCNATYIGETGNT
ncbi:hypothetical protein M514_25711 [Trichuris suis]|uniref:Uncharacterized protein n=1 Tax=Trichuris suis TaxID=68888 RepID=A0A085MUT1_9BILA|nr:hypothetical protein M513_10672 [Trichuris suis]KFD60977.1 hypothetical protein M514_10672 [Trichuris suis]KFD62109.1 hypothetical protein M514_25711 [Trichuris suis]